MKKFLLSLLLFILFPQFFIGAMILGFIIITFAYLIAELVKDISGDLKYM